MDLTTVSCLQQVAVIRKLRKQYQSIMRTNSKGMGARG